MTLEYPVIFDGHSDTVMDLRAGKRSFFERSDIGHVDLPRARKGGMGGGFFAVVLIDPMWTEAIERAEREGCDPSKALANYSDTYSDPARYPEPMPLAYAQHHALAQLGTLIDVERQSEGQVRIVHTAAEIEQCLASHVFAMIIHFEGAEPIDFDGYALDVYYAAGLRSVGLTHSRRNRYTEGVPFQFPVSPDTGAGLNEHGKELVRQLNARKIMVDLSHITEQGFWDVADITDAPLVCTHSNAWALCNSPRNLTDKQLDAIRDSKGVVGLNYCVAFISEDGSFQSDPPIEKLCDHVLYMAERMGVDHVALGSDFDGAKIPSELKDATGLPKLMQAIKDRGVSDDDLIKIAHGNWVRVFRETWGE